MENSVSVATSENNGEQKKILINNNNATHSRLGESQNVVDRRVYKTLFLQFTPASQSCSVKEINRQLAWQLSITIE